MKKALYEMSKEEIRNYKEDLEDDYAENLETINFYSQALEDRSNIKESKDVAILLTKFVLHAHDILGTLEAVEMYE
ncbi:hypothetical protein CPR19092_LGOLGGFK_01662 [Companilactobacillus paralimentarius]|uniref:hypothetical protein n=1 Tax=Companilactobacillus paralimentarius TaxID=83526 RepID=UPI00384F684E